MKKIPTLIDREVKKITKTIKQLMLNTMLFSSMVFLLVGGLYDTFIEEPPMRSLVNNLIIIGGSVGMLLVLTFHIRKLYIHLKLIYQSILIDVNTVINALHECDPNRAAKLTGVKISKSQNQTIH